MLILSNPSYNVVAEEFLECHCHPEPRHADACGLHLFRSSLFSSPHEQAWSNRKETYTSRKEIFTRVGIWQDRIIVRGTIFVHKHERVYDGGRRIASRGNYGGKLWYGGGILAPLLSI